MSEPLLFLVSALLLHQRDHRVHVVVLVGRLGRCNSYKRAAL